MGAVSTLFLVFLSSPCKATELIYGIENEIKDYNISRSVDKNAFALAELVTEGLFYQKPDGTLVPDLVKSYRRDGRSWYFDIRPSVFSNGKKLGCSDIYANIEEARNSPRPVKSRLREIESLRCEAERLVILTKKPYPQLIQRMGHIIRIYEASTLQSKNPIGSGPYLIHEKKGKDIVLIPNPFSSTKYSYKRIIFRALRDPWLRDLALLSGNVDFLMETFSKLRIQALETKKKLKVFRNPTPMMFYLVLKKEKFSLEQRIFLREFFYRENIVTEFWGAQVEATQKVFKESTQPSFLNQGLKIKPFTVEVSVVADETQMAFLKLAAQKLEPRGIRLKLRPLEFVSFMKRLNSKNFDAYFFYIDTSHAQNLEALLHSRGNRLDIVDLDLDKLFAKYAGAEKPAELMSILNSLEQKIALQAYLIPLYRSYRELFVSSAIKIEHSNDGFWRDLLRSHKYTGNQ